MPYGPSQKTGYSHAVRLTALVVLWVLVISVADATAEKALTALDRTKSAATHSAHPQGEQPDPEQEPEQDPEQSAEQERSEHGEESRHTPHDHIEHKRREDEDAPEQNPKDHNKEPR